LAYLDSAGYSERSNRKSPYDQFRAILERYFFVVEKIQRVLAGAEEELAEATPIEGDARCLLLQDSSIDGILFSPPYSFAIDYLENDSFHLGFLGVDINKLREEMVGLRGRTLRDKFDFYKADMERVISECARILRPGRICTIVVGTNNNQLSRILGVSSDAVQGIDELLIELGASRGLHLVRKIGRQITGMANTMRTEYIVMLQRN
jgi:SAM-dependent methyltransferase